MTKTVNRVRASVVCVDRGELLCVRLRDPVSGVARLFVPGGAIEPGETPAQAAAREALEETGYQLVVDETSERVERYPFFWAGVQVACVTHFFRARLTGDRRQRDGVEDAPYNEGARWLELSRLDAELGFHRAIHDAVAELAGMCAAGRGG
jgi:8-oxo-dGTP pyrophosphatase MutT (NUDIX family)